ncbi:hypothetical protein LOC71_14035 [Rhodopirellula sp. JC740]|uniref:Uncharacterized protein n=1 Tax=Rhodopirellula halodulae TaxID=2894198 RepID=A0ABS8NIL4_9BACT|nr:hypothetical protein [Rhodopirellula sp. JC740]MCC9643400.1 hypothetical protein [Rhodopirellula sp. JC740]
MRSIHSHFRTANIVAAAVRMLVVLACVSCFGGCVALGVPSERLHDPDDHGGFFGDWRRGRPHSNAQHTQNLIEDGAVIVPTDGHGVLCESGGCESSQSFVAGSGVLDGVSPMDLDPITGERFVEQEKPPEVPWPRFHPVPTRPVFGTGLVADPQPGI